MKVIEMLKLSRCCLELLQKSCINIRDCRFIDLYDEYERMISGGEKISYVVAILSERYEISERQVYYVIRKFSSDCKIVAGV